ncbi:MAG: purine-nucleoside phosphorylase [Coriobacteriales bacterium]|jgi:purine-nucleoside phosphorylase|nr:purine-nucleoside phosphorylase [Coriobacteriales bacterium]
MALQDRINEAVAFIQPQLSEVPDYAIVLGSGLSGLAELVDVQVIVDYKDIPYFKTSGAPGHVGRLLFGHVGGKSVACMQGRLHFYEGNKPEDTVFPLQVLNALGAQTLVVTNAAGGINLGFEVGDIMLITDHINFTGAHPLTIGDEQGLHDFLDMTYTYSRNLQDVARQVAVDQGLNLREGVYLGVRGPSFETPAEIRAFRVWGADAVGMSTVFEVLAANLAGMQILGFSLITNMAAGVLDQPLSGEEVIETAAFAAGKMQKLVLGVLAAL